MYSFNFHLIILRRFNLLVQP